MTHTHDVHHAIPLTPAIAEAVELVRVHRLALHHAIRYQSQTQRVRRSDMDVACARTTVGNVERNLVDLILAELDGKEST